MYKPLAKVFSSPRLPWKRRPGSLLDKRTIKMIPRQSFELPEPSEPFYSPLSYNHSYDHSKKQKNLSRLKIQSVHIIHIQSH